MICVTSSTVLPCLMRDCVAEYLNFGSARQSKPVNIGEKTQVIFVELTIICIHDFGSGLIDRAGLMVSKPNTEIDNKRNFFIIVTS